MFPDDFRLLEETTNLGPDRNCNHTHKVRKPPRDTSKLSSLLWKKNRRPYNIDMPGSFTQGPNDRT